MIKVDLRKRLTAFGVCLFTLYYIHAQNVTINGLKYYLFPDTHEAVINNRNTWSGELDIPSEIKYNGERFTVTGIASNAFLDCNELTKVKIPKTIEYIVHRVLTDDPDITGETHPNAMNPFIRCTALESIEVDKNNPIMSSEDGILYSKDKTRLYAYPAGRQHEAYSIPGSITWIGVGAICYNNYLSSLTIPNNVTYCGSVCDNCKNLKMVRLSECITNLPAYAFDRCESLRFLDIPESVQSFGESVFRWTHLEKIVIRGTFPYGLREDTFYFMDDTTIIYVQPSEMEKFKLLFSGTILPLEEYTNNIKLIELHQPSVTVFDLQGRQINGQPQHGIYIKSGKKYVKL